MKWLKGFGLAVLCLVVVTNAAIAADAEGNTPKNAKLTYSDESRDIGYIKGAIDYVKDKDWWYFHEEDGGRYTGQGCNGKIFNRGGLVIKLYRCNTKATRVNQLTFMKKMVVRNCSQISRVRFKTQTGTYYYLKVVARKRAKTGSYTVKAKFRPY